MSEINSNEFGWTYGHYMEKETIPVKIEFIKEVWDLSLHMRRALYIAVGLVPEYYGGKKEDYRSSTQLIPDDLLGYYVYYNNGKPEYYEAYEEMREFQEFFVHGHSKFKYYRQSSPYAHGAYKLKLETYNNSETLA